MMISISLPDEHQYSIMQRVLDGTLAVESVEEFKEILAIYPDDALLFRKYADLLLSKNHLAEAVVAFDKASRLFIDQGMNLQAIVAKILQWGIEKPTHDQGVQFHRQLSKNGGQFSPLQRLWANLRYSELVTIMLRLVRIRLSAGDKIARVEDPASEIFFVVSGTLMETWSEDCQEEASRAGVEIEPRLIGPSDIFGDIFPLNETTVNHTDVSAVTDAELVKIAKSVLFEACRKHPRIEGLLHEIYKPENVEKCDRAWQTVRRSTRFGVPTKVELFSPDQTGQDMPHPAERHTGIAVDISLGGMCVDMGSAASFDHRLFSKGRPVRSILDLLNKVAMLDLSGKIVWQRVQESENGAAMLIGICFDPLNTTDRELLIEYCSGSYGEQNLLWSLWDTMVKPDDTAGNP
jgi:PilZ domain/Cyclic nucleotide-binding domain